MIVSATKRTLRCFPFSPCDVDHVVMRFDVGWRDVNQQFQFVSTTTVGLEGMFVVILLKK
jgi:hypothetical protein